VPPEATFVRACGWVTMTGAAITAPLLDELLLEEELDELLDDELLELDEELEELELDELLLDDELLDVLFFLLLSPPQAVSNKQESMTVQRVVRRATGINSAKG